MEHLGPPTVLWPFLTQNKALNFRGNFGALLERKFVAQNKHVFVPKFALQTCHLKNAVENCLRKRP